MMLNIVKEYLQERGWKYDQPQDDALTFGVNGKNGSFGCIANIDEKDKKAAFFTLCEIHTPEERRIEMLKLINSLNNSFLLGNFELHPQTGEVRFKIGANCHFLELDKKYVDMLAMTSIITMDNCLPALLGVISGTMTADAGFNYLNASKN